MNVLDCPINSAHQQERKADSLINYKKYERAIECLDKAIYFIDQASARTKVRDVLTSLKLQKESLQRRKRTVLQLDEESRRSSSPCSSTGSDQTDDVSEDVLQTLYDCDTLLAELVQRQGCTVPPIRPLPNGMNTSKVLEELHMHNAALQKHVRMLLDESGEKDRQLKHYKLLNQQLEQKLHQMDLK
ncbi:DgyrCDS302 [Dimorphilus gyrociliatus]|uniref:DgyrCDS302 n=1 Tax=Dimorphilus gyrociliatus TaxID=2664684 RepID=A0A7I8V6Y3_9ANNE|nr:DgyrCDS302 [Dimorphilus gyrociliatus]